MGVKEWKNKKGTKKMRKSGTVDERKSKRKEEWGLSCANGFSRHAEMLSGSKTVVWDVVELRQPIQNISTLKPPKDKPKRCCRHVLFFRLEAGLGSALIQTLDVCDICLHFSPEILIYPHLSDSHHIHNTHLPVWVTFASHASRSTLI